MPKRVLPIMTVYLWDLRAQCEAQIRALTDAQRQIDTLRDSEDAKARTGALAKFKADLDRVRRVNADIRAAIDTLVEEAEQLEPSATRRKGT